ncbi:MAG: helix-turn-helix domain-containing protein [Acidobacteria bacterium]|nr:helix-turn-helix domain-containing protein [Acidobacteriota bacterium]
MHLKLDALVEEMIVRGVHFQDAKLEFERCFTLKVLERNKGSITMTAQTLGLHRNTLASRIKTYQRARARASGRS